MRLRFGVTFVNIRLLIFLMAFLLLEKPLKPVAVELASRND